MSGSKLTAYCVGQGDALRLKFGSPECPFHNVNFQIDLGPSATRSMLDAGGAWVLVLTHSHDDHIGGLAAWMSSLATRGDVKYWELWLPAYYDELVRVAEFLNDALAKLGFTPKVAPAILQNLSVRQLIGTMSTWTQPAGSHTPCPRPVIRCIYARDDHLTPWGHREPAATCQHLGVLNPPLEPESALGLSAGEIARMFERVGGRDAVGQRLLALVAEGDADLWRAYFSGDRDFVHLPPLQYGTADEVGEVVGHRGDDAGQEPLATDRRRYTQRGPSAADRRTFALALLARHLDRLERFALMPTQRRLDSLATAVQADLNNVSIVMSYRDTQADIPASFLLTGDAGKPVFDRLLGNDSSLLAHDVLKVPHHGSKHNLSPEILSAIAPKTAIISHGNGKFGRAKDPHPNTEVLQMLKTSNIALLLTADVEKLGTVVASKTLGSHAGGTVEICP